jgi:hypothetical protein
LISSGLFAGEREFNARYAAAARQPFDWWDLPQRSPHSGDPRARR